MGSQLKLFKQEWVRFLRQVIKYAYIFLCKICMPKWNTINFIIEQYNTIGKL